MSELPPSLDESADEEGIDLRTFVSSNIELMEDDGVWTEVGDAKDVGEDSVADGGVSLEEATFADEDTEEAGTGKT